MAYLFQTFSVGQILTAAQINQLEENILKHEHGVTTNCSTLSLYGALAENETVSGNWMFLRAGGTPAWVNRILRIEQNGGSGAGITLGAVLNNYGWIQSDLNGGGTQKDLVLQPLGGVLAVGTTTLETWQSNRVAVQIGTRGRISATNDANNILELWVNSHRNATPTDAYDNNGVAAKLEGTAGEWHFRVAPSGTAGNAISWLTGLSILNDGKVKLGSAFSTNSVRTDFSLTADTDHYQLANNAGTVYARMGLKASSANLYFSTNTVSDVLVIAQNGDITVSNTTKVTNLNADMLDGYEGNELHNIIGIMSFAIGTYTVNYVSTYPFESATENDHIIIVPAIRKAQKFYVKIQSNTMNGQTVVTVRKNNADTALTLTFTASENATKSDTTNVVTFLAGDVFCVSINTSASSSGSLQIQYSLFL